MKNILITAANHPLSGLVSLLLQTEENIIIVDSDIDTFKLPQENSSSYAHEMLSIALSHNITHIIPLKEKEVFALAEAKVLYEEYEIQVLIPDLNQLKNLLDIQEKTFVTSLTVDTLEYFSKRLLEIGYPDKAIALGSVNGKGELIRIDDSISDKIDCWHLPHASSFIQINKWLKAMPFTGIRLYELPEEKLSVVNVLKVGEEVYSYPKINVEINTTISQFLKVHKLQGLYEVAFSGTKIIRLKNQVI